MDEKEEEEKNSHTGFYGYNILEGKKERKKTDGKVGSICDRQWLTPCMIRYSWYDLRYNIRKRNMRSQVRPQCLTQMMIFYSWY